MHTEMRIEEFVASLREDARDLSLPDKDIRASSSTSCHELFVEAITLGGISASAIERRDGASRRRRSHRLPTKYSARSARSSTRSPESSSVRALTPTTRPSRH